MRPPQGQSTRPRYLDIDPVAEALDGQFFPLALEVQAAGLRREARQFGILSEIFTTSRLGIDEPEVKRLDFMAAMSRRVLAASGSQAPFEEYGAYDTFNATHVLGTCRNPETDPTGASRSAASAIPAFRVPRSLGS